MENKNVVILDAVNSLRILMDEVAKGKKPNFKSINSHLDCIENATLDGRKVAWTEERRQQHSEKVTKAAELRNKSRRIYCLKGSEKIVFDSLDEVAKVLRVQVQSLRNKLSISKNQAQYTKAGFNWIVSTDERLHSEHFVQPEEQDVNPAIILTQRAAERRAQRASKK